MLQELYVAYEIREDGSVRTAKVEGTVLSIGNFARECEDSSILLMAAVDSTPFLVALSIAFLYCSEEGFLDGQLIPYLRDMRKDGGNRAWSG